MRLHKTAVFCLFMICLLAAGLALGDTTISFPTIYGQVTLDETKFIILQPDNLAKHQEWMANRGITEESLLADWEERGVLLQAWTSDSSSCLEITAVHDNASETYFDLDQQTPAIRATYRQGHQKGTLYKDQGYTYSSAEWKNTTQYGRFLMLRYKRVDGENTYRGYARRAVRNGYTITVDLQVYGRSLNTQDQNTINKVMGTWHFTSVLPLPGTPGQNLITSTSDSQQMSVTVQTADENVQTVPATISISQEPPHETTTGSFTVKGTCNPNLHIVGVVMRMTSNDPLRLETEASKKGSFSLPVQLPEEGTWLMTLTFLSGNQEVGEMVFGTTLYQQSMLPVNFTQEVPDHFTSDSFTLSGVTAKNTKIQCIVDGILDKSVTTNNSGKFSFKFSTADEGTYKITLVLMKKGYNTRRFTWEVGRHLTELELNNRIRTSAIKPAYKTLNAKLDKYVGRYMKYNLYVTSVTRSGDEWIIFMAMNATKKGGYTNLVVVTASEDPSFEIGTQHWMYGKLVGKYEVQSQENGSVFYPCFELAFWGS